MTDTSDTADEVTSLQCMNVWGGNEPTHSALGVTGIDVTVRCRPWHDEEQGGDLYLVSMCACATISRFILADVAGHGMRVAPLARRLRRLMYKHINRPDQTHVARSLSSEFADLEASGRFATALLLTYLPETDHLIVCNAGHPPPLWYRQCDQAWHTIDANDPAVAEVADPNFPIGVLPGTAYEQCAIQLDPGDLIVLYSDGLIEAAAPTGERMLGVEGLRTLLAKLSPEPTTLADHLLDQVSPPQNGAADDDQTVVVLHHNAENPPQQSMSEKLAVLARMIGVKASLLSGRVPDESVTA